jgi:hypothetical protein
MTTVKLSFRGTVTATYTSHGQSGRGPYKFQLEDDTHQARWFSSFDKKLEPMVEKAGLGAGWVVEYVEKPWGENNDRISYDVTGITSTPRVANKAPVQDEPKPETVSEPAVIKNEDITVCQHGVSQVVYNAKCGVCIIRQVAFKEIENKSDISENELWRLTNLYQDILLGHYIPEDETDQFIASVPQ